ncbi:MAG: AtpZ/AtpI family protein [Flavobacteriaceae bacterium]|nr:AtpZ/AtpI family protein [Flavobacteriaceae bacterium]
MKKQPKHWLVFSSLAVQIAVVVYAAIKGGHWLDQYFKTQSNFWALSLSALGIILILILIQKQSKHLNDT